MSKVLALIIQAGLTSGGFLTPEQAQEISALTDGLLSLVLSIAIIALSVGVPMLLRSIHLHLLSVKSKTQWSFLAVVANNAVQSAEKTILHGDNITKYDYASKILSDTAKSHGIKWVTPDICRLLIESALYGIEQAERNQGNGSDGI